MVGAQGRNAKRGGVAGGRLYRIEFGSWLDRIEQGRDPPQDRRFTRRALQGLFRGGDQILGMKGCGKALEPQRRHFPVAIAARPAQQIQLPPRAFGKRRAQFAKQRRIITGRHCQMGIDCVAKVSHRAGMIGNRLSCL